MKKYIFITFSIQCIGGGQCYTAGKAKYLEQNGWDVIVFSGGHPKSKHNCPIEYLNKFKKNLVLELDIAPHKLPKLWVEKVLHNLCQQIGSVSEKDEIIIESHHDSLALWGELLASEIHGRHVFFALTEHYRNKGASYEPKMDFFMYKMGRGEILCNSITANRLFSGYKHFEENEIEPAWLNEDPVQDVKSIAIENLQRYDYNVCYIGRADKPYVQNVIIGIKSFSLKHEDKIAQFVFVGDSQPVKETLDEASRISNLVITELGPLHPLPKCLFEKIDVVIAGSGSARCSVENGALTIIADPDSKQSMGLLGYDTNESVFNSGNIVLLSFDEALENVLVKKDYLNKSFSYQPSKSVEECTVQNFSLIDRAEQELSYYDKNKLLKGCINPKLCLKLFLQHIFR